jgi:hypothetical protein
MEFTGQNFNLILYLSLAVCNPHEINKELNKNFVQ